MDNNIILILAASVYSLVAAGLLGGLVWAEVLDGREDQITTS